MITLTRSATLRQDASHARLLHQTVDNTKADGPRDVSGEAQEVSLLDHSSTNLGNTPETLGTPAETAVTRRALRSPALLRTAAPGSAQPTKPRTSMTSWKRTLLNAGAMTVATAIVATLALPGTAIPEANAESNASAEAVAELQATSSQEIELTAAEAVVIDASRAEFTATDPASLRRAQLAAERAAAVAAWSGPSVSDFLANPPYPSFSLDQVVQVGLQYQGVPYRRGGATPAGFDCSGFTQYVYAQFGVSLPHSVSGQDRAGTRISRADALPGDLVIMAGHNGIYMGNGTFLDAPRSGGVVSVRPIWTDNYWIVRVGI